MKKDSRQQDFDFDEETLALENQQLAKPASSEDRAAALTELVLCIVDVLRERDDLPLRWRARLLSRRALVEASGTRLTKWRALATQAMRDVREEEENGS